MRGASPLWVQILTFTLGPPLGAAAWAAISRGWAYTVQGGKISERTRKRQKVEFWVLLCVAYLMCFAMFVYAHFLCTERTGRGLGFRFVLGRTGQTLQATHHRTHPRFQDVVGFALESLPYVGKYATGFGEVKLGHDFVTYVGSLGLFAAGVIH